MVTREILSWFVVGSLCTPVYPSPPKFQFNLENVSNQWWAPGWGLLEIQSLKKRLSVDLLLLLFSEVSSKETMVLGGRMEHKNSSIHLCYVTFKRSLKKVPLMKI